MAFTGDNQKLTGDDGYLKYAEFSTEIPGDAATALPAPGVYLITKVAAVSTFPAAALGGSDPAAGDILVLKTGDSITPAVDDDVVTLTMTDQCDISGWTMEFSKEEIDVTTLCDIVKKYRAGKADMSGTMNGVFTIGTTDSTTGVLRQFIPIAKQDGDASFDRFDQEEAILLAQLYMNDDTNIGDEEYIWAPVQMYGTGTGGELGAAQSFSSSFRFANLSYTDSGNAAEVDILPTAYRLGDGT
jgi:hypothetical protein